jgi:hypothetical protein
MKTETEPDDKRLFDQFRSGGMDADGAYIAVQEIRTMAGQNIIAKMDAQAVAQDAKLESIRAEMKTETQSIRWVIFVVVLIATLVLAIVQIFSK